MSYKSAVQDRVFILRWGPPELADAEALLRDCQEASKAAGHPLIVIMIMPQDVPAPEGDVRNAFGRCAGRLLDCCESIHCMIEGDGFKNSIKRSVTTSVLLVTGKRGKMFVHKTLLDVLESLRPRLLELDIQSSAIIRAAQAKGLLTTGVRAKEASYPTSEAPVR